MTLDWPLTGRPPIEKGPLPSWPNGSMHQYAEPSHRASPYAQSRATSRVHRNLRAWRSSCRKACCTAGWTPKSPLARLSVVRSLCALCFCRISSSLSLSFFCFFRTAVLDAMHHVCTRYLVRPPSIPKGFCTTGITAQARQPQNQFRSVWSSF